MSISIINSSISEMVADQAVPILSSAFWLYHSSFMEEAAQSLKSLGEQIWRWFRASSKSSCAAASGAQAQKVIQALDCCSYDRFDYTDYPKKSLNLFEVQNTILLPQGSTLKEVYMYDPPQVLHVSDKPVFLYTDFLRTCVGVLGKSKTSTSSNLIGVAHLYTDTAYWHNTKSIASGFSTFNDFLLDVDRENLIKKGHFIPHKIIHLVDQFRANPNYQGEKIELFFTGGMGTRYSALWQELLVRYAKQIPNVEVVGTYFNPFQALPGMETTEDENQTEKFINLPFSTLAGITNEGSILIRKSCDFEFELQDE